MPSTSTNRPLITFAVGAYNQEEYIHEAIEGAFSQTYSPLEIILSDDCSTDSTFEIMKKMAAEYRGPHRILLNRNKHNLHIGGHVSAIMRMASGILVVGAAGDDISVPERTEECFQHWLRNGLPPFASIFSQSRDFREDKIEEPSKVGVIQNPKGQPDTLFQPVLSINGCAHAWTKSLFDFFGDLAQGVVNEDGAILFRARLTGSLLFIQKSLVYHRSHGANTGSAGLQTANSQSGLHRFFITVLSRRITLLQSHHNDLVLFNGSSMSAERPSIANQADSCIHSFGQEAVFCKKAIAALDSTMWSKLYVIIHSLLVVNPTTHLIRKLWLSYTFPNTYLLLKRLHSSLSVANKTTSVLKMVS